MSAYSARSISVANYVFFFLSSKYLLIRAGLPALEKDGDPLLVLLEDVVVQDPPHGSGRPAAAGLHVETTDVPGDEVIVEKHVLGKEENRLHFLNFKCNFPGCLFTEIHAR